MTIIRYISSTNRKTIYKIEECQTVMYFSENTSALAVQDIVEKLILI